MKARVASFLVYYLHHVTHHLVTAISFLIQKTHWYSKLIAVGTAIMSNLAFLILQQDTPTSSQLSCNCNGQ